ncbi:hypothetical protein EON80_26715 [bacterium]|nr:MAG: hypothetical protein EON80_26715 [bacterium]
MKSYIPYSLLAAAAACGLAFAQETAYTTPVGYTTQTLAANSFNLVGINLQTPTTVAGTLTAVSGTQLSDSNADFTALLPAGSTGVLEILDGPASGTTQEFTTYAGNSITVPVEIANLAAGAKYRVRIATTLSEGAEFMVRALH